MNNHHHDSFIQETTDDHQHDSFNIDNHNYDSFKQECYSIYQLTWMLEHGISLQNLFDQLQACTVDPARISLKAPKGQNNATFLADSMESGKEALLEAGLDEGDIWLTYDEFIQNQFLDSDYMIGLLSRYPERNDYQYIIQQYKQVLRDIQAA